MIADGRKTPALRFAVPRVGTLCQTLLSATGFTTKSVSAVIASLLGSDYRPGQMTYDLRCRLRLAGLITRLPHTNRYTLHQSRSCDSVSRCTRSWHSTMPSQYRRGCDGIWLDNALSQRVPSFTKARVLDSQPSVLASMSCDLKGETI